MRVPIVRFGDDESPVVWWEWLFAPLLCGAFFLVVPPLLVVSVVAAVLYPDQHPCELDTGTPREQELARRYRQFTQRVSVWRRMRRVCLLRGRRRGRRHRR